MEEGNDFTRYIEILIRRWYLVIAPLILSVIIVATVNLSLPKKYLAEAMVIAIRSIAQVSYNTAITTSSEDSLTMANTSQRLASLSSLVLSPSIAHTVLVSIAEQLSMQERSVESLFKIVQTEIVPKSDLIVIKVIHTNPQLATEIADLWSKEYVRQINALYSSAETESYSTIQREIPTANANYKVAQATLEKWIQENRLSELSRRRDAIKETIDSLTASRRAGVQAQLSDLQRTDFLLRTVLDLHDQLIAGGPAAAWSNSAALGSLKLQVFGAIQQTQTLLLMPIQLQANPDLLSSSEMMSDTESLISVLQTRLRKSSGYFWQVADGIRNGQSWPLLPGTSDQQLLPEEQGPTLDQNLDQVLLNLESQLNALDTSIEKASSQFIQVTSERDLAWETYNNVIRKEAELKLAVATAGAEVRLGPPPGAVLVENSLFKSLGIGALVGLILGILGAFALDFWSGYRTRMNAGSDNITGKPIS